MARLALLLLALVSLVAAHAQGRPHSALRPTARARHADLIERSSEPGRNSPLGVRSSKRGLMEQMGQIYSELSDHLYATTKPKPPIRIATASYTFGAPAPLPTTYVPPSISLGDVLLNPRIDSPAYKRLSTMLADVMTHAVDVSFNSWELGTLTQSLLEIYMPGLTPFEWDSTAVDRDIPWDMLKIVQASLWQVDWNGAPGQSADQDKEYAKYLDSRTSPTAHNGRTLIGGDGSLGDPCSLGWATWVLANYAGKDDEVRYALGLRGGADYAWAVGNQLSHLYWSTRSDNGTFSMREEGFELWADIGYMVPPFLSYLGLSTGNNDLLAAGLDQWILESSALFDTEQGLYRHINAWDARFWATGNGWMLMGALRVLASIRAAGLQDTYKDKIAQVEGTMAQCFQTVLSRLDGDSLVPNYVNEGDSRLAKGDSAGTALIVAAFYRFAATSDWQLSDLNPKASAAFDAVMSRTTDDGWLTQVVDPMGTHGWVVSDDPGMHSPEGQSFLGMMWAARTAAGF